MLPRRHPGSWLPLSGDSGAPGAALVPAGGEGTAAAAATPVPGGGAARGGFGGESAVLGLLPTHPLGEGERRRAGHRLDVQCGVVRDGTPRGRAGPAEWDVEDTKSRGSRLSPPNLPVLVTYGDLSLPAPALCAHRAARTLSQRVGFCQPWALSFLNICFYGYFIFRVKSEAASEQDEIKLSL